MFNMFRRSHNSCTCPTVFLGMDSRAEVGVRGAGTPGQRLQHDRPGRDALLVRQRRDPKGLGHKHLAAQVHPHGRPQVRDHQGLRRQRYTLRRKRTGRGKAIYLIINGRRYFRQNASAIELIPDRKIPCWAIGYNSGSAVAAFFDI